MAKAKMAERASCFFPAKRQKKMRVFFFPDLRLFSLPGRKIVAKPGPEGGNKRSENMKFRHIAPIGEIKATFHIFRSLFFPPVRYGDFSGEGVE